MDIHPVMVDYPARLLAFTHNGPSHHRTSGPPHHLRVPTGDPLLTRMGGRCPPPLLCPPRQLGCASPVLFANS